MTVTVSSFRTTFTAFSDTTKYPDTLVNFFIALYVQMVNADRWGDQTDFGVSLAVAHNLALEAMNNKAANMGGIPGQVGIVNSKSVDKVSVGYDVTTGTQEGAGFWHMTNYGTRDYRYAMMFGAGPVQVNTGDCGGGAASAWPGPYYNY